MTADDLKSWRDRLHLSQEKAAKALGCSKTSIIAWEHGQPIPQYIALACAALAYGLPPMSSQTRRLQAGPIRLPDRKD